MSNQLKTKFPYLYICIFIFIFKFYNFFVLIAHCNKVAWFNELHNNMSTKCH